MRAILAAAILVCGGCKKGPEPLLGVYTYGPEVNSFRPCGGSDTFWVLGADSVLQALRAAHDSLSAGPGEGILVRAFTRHSGRGREGFAQRYDANLGITQVLETTAPVPEHCLETEWALPGRRPTYFR